MNDKIVKNAVNNFLQEHDLNSSVLREGCEEFLWKSFREMRKEDSFLAEEIEILSSMNQTRLLERRLEMEFVDDQEILECIGNSVINAFSKAIELNECLGEEYVEEYCQNLFEDCICFLSEDESLTQKITRVGKEKIIETIKYIFKAVPTTLIAGIPIVLKLAGATTVWGSLLALLLLIIAGGITNIASNNKLQRDQIDFVKGIVDFMTSLAKMVKSGGEKFKYKYQLTFSNEEKCYIKAGLDPNKMGLRHMMSLKDKSLWTNLLLASEKTKIDILRRCYLEGFLDRISIFFSLYFDCLKKTGNWNEVRSMSDDKFISMFRMKGGLYPMCDQFRDNAVKAINTFEDLVDYLYSKSPEKKSEWMLLLNRYILDQKISQDDLKKDFNKKQGGDRMFTNDKYRRMGRDIEQPKGNYQLDYYKNRDKNK